MMIRFGSWLINVEEIEAVITIAPNKVRVQMNSGRAYDLNCKDDAEQTREIEKILREIELHFPPPVNRYELDTVVQKATDKIRSDIRVLRKLVTAEMEGLRNG